MGCDLNWNAHQDNIKKQKQASLFVHALLDMLNGKIGDLPYSDLEFYNGSYSGYFLDFDTLSPKTIVKRIEGEPDSIVVRNTYETDWENFKPEYLTGEEKFDLVGFTAHFWGKTNAKEDAETNYPDSGIAEWQFSFVFNNSPTLADEQKNQLVTIEFMDDLSWRRWENILKHFKDTPKDTAKAKYGVYQKGAYVRNCSLPLLLIFYIVKQLYIPKLKVSDDYREFQAFEERMEQNGVTAKLSDPRKRWKAIAEITDDFLEMKFDKDNIDPNIKTLWGVDLD